MFLEHKFHEYQLQLPLDFQRDEAVELVADAIRAGIFNDLGSGSNVDVCVITKDKVDYIRPYDIANKKGVRLVWKTQKYGGICSNLRCGLFFNIQIIRQLHISMVTNQNRLYPF